jgi:hypothetical protein
MRTNLKVILAAMSIAVLTSPVMAEKANRHAPRDSNETFSTVNDCVRTAFPQCGGNWRRTRHIHKVHHIHKSHGDQ